MASTRNTEENDIGNGAENQQNPNNKNMLASAIASAVGGGLNLLDSTIGNKQRAKLAEKQGFQDTNSRLLQIRQQREQQRLEQIQNNARTTRTLLIVGGVVLIGIIMTLVFIYNKK
ncbi:MAG: hypothetical protein MUC49_02285 [Raineya sp.]|jgi:hypothetical protein|nr:hypothetical protein [Raineya sp.]